MNDRIKINRPVAPAELAVIRAVLERGPAFPDAALLADGLEALRTIDQCGCGCDSVDFQEHDPARPARPIAEGIGTTPAGGQVGLIIWGREDAVTGLEVYDLGAGDLDLKLPQPSSIQKFTAGAA